MQRKGLKPVGTVGTVGYSSESPQGELSNEYQHDRVWMVFKKFCVRVLWTKIASALEGFTLMHLVANLANTNFCKNPEIMSETVAYG